MDTPGPPPSPRDTPAAEWTRDYFDNAYYERLQHLLTERELDELCYFVGLLVSTDAWPPRAGSRISDRSLFGFATITRADLGAFFVQRIARRPAGTSSVEVFFAVLPDRRRVRIVNIIATSRLKRRRERDVILDAAALRAFSARLVP